AAVAAGLGGAGLAGVPRRGGRGARGVRGALGSLAGAGRGVRGGAAPARRAGGAAPSGDGRSAGAPRAGRRAAELAGRGALPGAGRRGAAQRGAAARQPAGVPRGDRGGRLQGDDDAGRLRPAVGDHSAGDPRPLLAAAVVEAAGVGDRGVAGGLPGFAVAALPPPRACRRRGGGPGGIGMRRIVAGAAALLVAALGCVATEDRAADEAEVPAVRKAECRWARDRIRIDGVIDEVAWDRAPALRDFAVFWEKRKPRTATTARLLWDANYLYFCAEMEDEDLYATVREHN